MSNTSNEKSKDFLYLDENVKYSFANDGTHIIVQCDHPIFIRRFNGSSATLTAEEFFKSSPKGSEDYDFFQKLKTSIQEHFLDHGVK
jgi:hypothetical protein